MQLLLSDAAAVQPSCGSVSTPWTSPSSHMRAQTPPSWSRTSRAGASASTNGSARIRIHLPGEARDETTVQAAPLLCCAPRLLPSCCGASTMRSSGREARTTSLLSSTPYSSSSWCTKCSTSLHLRSRTTCTRPHTSRRQPCPINSTHHTARGLRFFCSREQCVSVHVSQSAAASARTLGSPSGGAPAGIPTAPASLQGQGEGRGSLDTRQSLASPHRLHRLQAAAASHDCTMPVAAV